MPRIRTIKPEFFSDPDLADCSPHARLAFIGLWCHADRAGRLKDEPRRLKGVLFPYEGVDMEALLDELVRGQFVIRYDSQGSRYLQVRTFGRHQVPHVKEALSTIPAPDEHSASTVLAPREGKGREGNGSGKGGGTEARGSAAEPAPTPVKLIYGSHKSHALCGYICLPGDLFSEFVRKSGQGDGERYVTEWFRRHNASLEAEHPAIGDDAFAFWRTRWALDHPTTRVSPRELDRRKQAAELEAWARGGTA